MPASPRPAPKPARQRSVKSEPKSEARPRTKPAEVRREELLDAAERLFLEKGLAATSVDEIVNAADVAKGTFYLHFASKEALLPGLQERFVMRFTHAAEKAVAKKRADDWKGRLRVWVHTTVSTYLENVALHDLVFHESHPDNRAEMQDNPFLNSLAELLAQGTHAGDFQVSDPKLTALMLFGALHGAADAATLADGEPARKNIVRALETFVLRAVGAR